MSNNSSETNQNPYDRDLFIKKWSTTLKCKPDAFSLAAALINEKKNCMSAVAVLFGLSWRDDREWLKKCETYLQENMVKFNWAKVDANWCIQFQKHYVTDVAKYPR